MRMLFTRTTGSTAGVVPDLEAADPEAEAVARSAEVPRPASEFFQDLFPRSGADTTTASAAVKAEPVDAFGGFDTADMGMGASGYEAFAAYASAAIEAPAAAPQLQQPRGALAATAAARRKRSWRDDESDLSELEAEDEDMAPQDDSDDEWRADSDDDAEARRRKKVCVSDAARGGLRPCCGLSSGYLLAAAVGSRQPSCFSHSSRLPLLAQQKQASRAAKQQATAAAKGTAAGGATSAAKAAAGAAARAPTPTGAVAAAPHLGAPPPGFTSFVGVDGANLTRAQRVARYLEKKKNRRFGKTIRYAARKAYAEIRPRIKGRFARKDEIAAWKAANGGDDAIVPECLDIVL